MAFRIWAMSVLLKNVFHQDEGCREKPRDTNSGHKRENLLYLLYCQKMMDNTAGWAGRGSHLKELPEIPNIRAVSEKQKLGQFIFPASLGLLVHTPWGSWSQMRWVSQWWDPLPQAMGRAWCTFKAGCCLCHSYPQDKTAKGFWRIQLPIHLPKRKRLELLGSTGSFFQNFHQNILASLTSSPHTA